MPIDIKKVHAEIRKETKRQQKISESSNDLRKKQQQQSRNSYKKEIS